jgi:hypothetical protein
MTRRLYETTRAAALASLVCAPSALTSRGHADPAGEGDQPFVAFMDKFWQEAWGSQFVLGQSGLLLERRAPGVFTVQVSDGERLIAQGVYHQLLRLEDPQPGDGPEPAGATDLPDIDHAVTAGLLEGSTGSINAVFGLSMTVAVEGLSVESFVPLGSAPDAEGAAQGARDLYAELAGAAPAFAGGEPPLELACGCIEEYLADWSACNSAHLQCQSSCRAMYQYLTFSCLFDFNADPADCIANAGTRYGQCVSNCLANRRACLRGVIERFLDCMWDCLKPGVPL